MKSKQSSWLLAVWLAGFAQSGLATPQVVGDAPCTVYAVDIEAFATCEGDRVVSPQRAATTYIEPDEVPPGKLALGANHLAAWDAYWLRRHDPRALLIDIRSRDEVSFVGWPLGADANVPFMEPRQPLQWDIERAGLKMERVAGFVEAIDALAGHRGLGRDAIVILMCRSGDRSARAAAELVEQGYSRVVTVIDGFEGDFGPDGRRSLNGWKNAGLPWVQRPPREAMQVGRL